MIQPAALLLALVCLPAAWADETPVTTTTPSPYYEAPYNQLVTIQVAPFRPSGLAVSNGSYSFNYSGDTLDSYLVEAGWAARLFTLLGTLYFEENLAVSSFSGNLAPSSGPATHLNLYMMGFDTRIMHTWDWFPWRSLVPFVDAGYQYTLYFQSGSSDLQSAQGGVGNPVAGAGLRLWLNRGSSMSQDSVNRLSSFPIFITAKVNRIFPQWPSPGSVSLDSISYFGGLSVGL